MFVLAQTGEMSVGGLCYRSDAPLTSPGPALAWPFFWLARSSLASSAELLQFLCLEPKAALEQLATNLQKCLELSASCGAAG